MHIVKCKIVLQATQTQTDMAMELAFEYKDKDELLMSENPNQTWNKMTPFTRLVNMVG